MNVVEQRTKKAEGLVSREAPPVMWRSTRRHDSINALTGQKIYTSLAWHIYTYIPRSFNPL